MTSGVVIADDVKEMIARMKVVKNDDDCNARVRVALLGMGAGDKEIVVTKSYEQQQMGDSTGFSIIAKEMEDNDCFYALYDCHFETKEGSVKDEMMFLTWTSDNASIKKKMLYASSKESLKGCIRGVKHHCQINDRGDWTREAIAEKIQSTTTGVVAKIEGTPV